MKFLASSTGWLTASLLVLAPVAFGAMALPWASNAEAVRSDVDGPDADGDDDERPANELRQLDAPPAGTTQWERSDAERATMLAALDRGLAWLAQKQRGQQDGSFPQGAAQHYVPVAVTALGSLAYMAGGNSPDRGPYGDELSRAIDYLVARCDRTEGSVQRGYISSDGDKLSRMHGHAYATLALAQAYSISPRSARGARTEEVLRYAVELIEKTQGAEGGWYYEPVRSFNHENSITVCQVQALRAARNAGLHVDERVISKAIDYILRCQDEDGRFVYALNNRKHSLAMTAAGMATLQSVGRYRGPEIERGARALARGIALEDDIALYPYYERLYLAQALWQSPDLRTFEEWLASEVASVLTSQRSDGSWGDRRYGDCYATAINCLFLAIPEGVLPIFQR